MKKTLLSSAFVLLSFIMACGGGGSGSGSPGNPDNPGSDPYAVTYDANGADSGTVHDGETVDAGESMTAAGAGDIVKSGYYFDGWNTAADGSGTAIDFGAEFTPEADTVLYARWVKVMELKVDETINGVLIILQDLINYGHTGSTERFFQVKGAIQGLSVFAIPKTAYCFLGDAPVRWVDFNGSKDIERAILQDGIYFVAGSGEIGCFNNGLDTKGGFEGCSKLRSVVLPDSIEWMGGRCFKDCVNLETVRLPEKVKVIEIDSFRNCTNLKSITIPPSSICTRIRDYAFADCTSLTSITLPPSLTMIEQSAFFSCKSLTSITIPSAVTEIGAFAFNCCENLTVINFPASLKTLSTYSMFMCCYALTAINVAEGNQYFKSEDGVLMSRDGTTLIQYPASKPGDSYTISSSVKTLGERAFQFSKNLRSLTIEDGLTAIPTNAFSRCKQLTSLTLPSTLTRIDFQAFGGCESLAELMLPANLTTIGENAFCGAALTTVTIPANVTSIGNGAFMGGIFETVHVKATTPPSLGDYAFTTMEGEIPSNLAIYVPSGYEQTYKDDPDWSAYADYINPEK